MSRGREWISYNFAVLRVVPHVHIGAFVPVGVVLHARTTEYLGARLITDPDELRSLAGDADIELLAKYLESCEAIARGDISAGPIAKVALPERIASGTHACWAPAS